MSLGQDNRPSVPHLPSPRKDSQPAIVTAANAAQPRRWWQAAFSAGRDKRRRRRLCRSCQRTVDHLDRVPKPVHRYERAEARTLLLAEQHLIEHVEPIERDTRLAVFALDLSSLVEERLAPTDFVDHLLDLLGGRIGGQLHKRLAQVEKRRTLALARLAEPLLRQHEVAKIVDGIAHESVELRMRLRRHTGTIAADEAPQRLGVLRVR